LRAGPRVEDAIVRLQLSGPRARIQAIDEREIRRELASAHFVIPVQRDYTDEARVRLAGADVQGKTPLEMVKLYFERQNVAAERRDLLLARARTLMAE
jgi:hypothetical protein